MGVIQKNFYFDNVNLATYGVFVTGSGAYNAPERDVELVEIPGRNGDYALDRGRFKNIEVTYPASIATDDPTTFASNMSTVRNILASRKGYVRIQDDYNPNEYRMGMYVSGLEVTPVGGNNVGGSFDMKFNCKPQRFLKSGETETAVANNGTISNPTQFESKPLLAAFGYGQISVNGYTITIQDTVLGVITLANPQTDGAWNVQFSSSALNVGDTITLEPSSISILFTANKAVSALSLTTSGSLSTTASSVFEVGDDQVVLNIDVAQQTYTNGTNNSKTGTVAISITYTDNTTASENLYVGLAYNAPNDSISVSLSMSGGILPNTFYVDCSFGRITGNSTKHSTGNPLYIDCELGDCYKIEGGETIFLNHYVSMPNGLPVLSAGSNTITYDNTITSFKITPRWWKI